MIADRFCTIEGCTRPLKARGMCNAHYHRMRRYGTTERVRKVAQRRSCSESGCSRPAKCQGLCARDYERTRRALARALAPDRTQERIEGRFRSKVVVRDDGCWEWTAVRLASGHGRFWLNGHNVAAHRFAYELLVGPIPEGLHIDHLCMNPPCVNPAHLEPVTPEENSRRWREAYGRGKYATHCKHGHELTPENTWVSPDRTRRQCRSCMKAKRMERKARRASAGWGTT